MSLGNMGVEDIVGAMEGADDIMGDLDGALDRSELGSLGAAMPGMQSPAVAVTKLVRDPVRLARAHKRAVAAEAAASARARATRGKFEIETDPAARAALGQFFTLHMRTAKQHRLTARTIHILANMRAADLAASAARPNYAFGLAFSANAGGSLTTPTATDTALIGPPITDRPWRVLAWQTSAIQAADFVVLNFTPTVDNVVTYGNNGVTYRAGSVAYSQIPLWAWCFENFLTPTNPRYNLAFWESPRYIFGPSAVVVMELGCIAAAGSQILVLGLGQCQPCGDPALPLMGPTSFVDTTDARYAHTPSFW